MRKTTLYILGMLAALLMVVSCASMGTPSGGPRDEDPPRFVFSTPGQGAVEVSPSKVVLTFDELVNVKDAFNKVVVSPPGSQTPRVSSLGRRVTVEFRDSLLPNTTYTVDFGDAIVDNNEGNKLENFFYTFSTGPTLDSLMVSGMVLGAEDLEPASGMYVGLHSNLADSAFMKQRFDRIAKTDDNGRFVIGGLAPGQYRIYALDDRDGDLAWSSPEESLAFYDTVIVPSAEEAVATDTIFNLLTGDVDTVVQRNRTRFVPNNILLRSYNSGYKQQYITKYERVDSTRINIIFNAGADSLATFHIVTPAGDSMPIETVAVTERSATNDTLSFWLRSPDIIRTDTLRLALNYLKADSAYNMISVADTLRLITQRAPVKKENPKLKVNKKDKKETADSVAEPGIPLVAFQTRISKPEVYQSIGLELPEPPDSVALDKFTLEWKEDTLWLPVKDFDKGNLRFDTLNPRQIIVDYPWEFETAYRLRADSLAATTIYGAHSDNFKLEFTIRPENEYSSIRFNVTDMGSDSIPRFVQLLDSRGTPIRSLVLDDSNSVTFEFLLAGKYSARIVEDYNGNGIWDPGNFELSIPPDVSYYYPDLIDLKSNWSQELDWRVFATPVDKMKQDSLKQKKTTR